MFFNNFNEELHKKAIKNQYLSSFFANNVRIMLSTNSLVIILNLAREYTRYLNSYRILFRKNIFKNETTKQQSLKKPRAVRKRLKP